MTVAINNQKVSNQRTRRLINNVFGTLLSRLVNLGSTIITVPLALKSLGPHDYGIFAVILSTVVFLSYSDLGLGMAVVNRVASAKDEQSLSEAREAISNVWYFLLRMSGFLLIAGIFTVAVIKVTNFAGSAFAWEAWSGFVVCIALGLAPGLTQRILFGLQRNFEANIWNTAGRIVSVFGVFLASYYNASMLWFVIAMLGLPAVVGWFSTIVLWHGTPSLKPDNSVVAYNKLRLYTGNGLQFMFLQIGVYCETGIDNVLIGSVQGTQFVTNYDLLTRLFVYVPAFVSMLAFPLWPAISHAKASGDDEWVRRAYKVSFLATGLASLVVSVSILYFHAEIIQLWVGLKDQRDFSLAMALAAFAILTSLGTVQAMLMSGLGFISDQVRIMVVFLAVLIPGKILALSLSGQTSMVWTLVVVYAIRLFSQWAIVRKNLNGNASKS